MRTLISHFYNEEFLLPWWLKHHVNMFDYGVLIDHGSTDSSEDIIREIAPHWRLVRSSLVRFDAYLTDLEVMNYEKEIPGWKIVLNTTEFLMPAMDLSSIQLQLEKIGKEGISCTGFVCVDPFPEQNPTYDRPLTSQKFWGFNENLNFSTQQRDEMSLTSFPSRNRFFHCSQVGMYHPGRHRSFHPDSSVLANELMVFYFGYSPWSRNIINRKLQIKTRLSAADIKRGWGFQHAKSLDQIENSYISALKYTSDLRDEKVCFQAIQLAEAHYSR